MSITTIIRRIPHIVLIASLLFFSMLNSGHAVTTYKWVDQDGNVVYSQHPPAEGEFERIQTIQPSRSGKGEAPKAASSARDSILKDQDNRDKNTLVEDEMAKNEEMRKKNCDIAKERLQFYQVQRRWKDKDGNIVSPTEAERKAKLEEAKQQVKDYCD